MFATVNKAISSDLYQQTEIVKEVGTVDGVRHVRHFERPRKISLEPEVQMDGLGPERSDPRTVRSR